MSVICCQVPDLLLTLAMQHHANWLTQPVALIGPDECVWAVTSPAQASGVRHQMSVRQAQSHCPEVHLAPVDLAEVQAAQDMLLQTLANWELPVEESGWGLAYLDLHTVASTRVKVQPLAVELGRQVRQALGGALQPCIGWDNGKFTAYTASVMVKPGRVRLVSRADEMTFLAPLPIKLLPFPPDDQQRLHWLGITTLGQFAKLPPAAVLQQFGNSGRMAQRWAQGHDPRPVRPQVRQAFAPLTADIDPPTGLLDPVLTTLIGLLRPQLDSLALELSGCRRLHLQLDFVEGSQRTLLVTFVAPIGQAQTLHTVLAHHLQTLIWPAELSRVTVVGLETGELPATQLTLFPDCNGDEPDPRYLAARLSGVYGSAFFQPTLPDQAHPVAERRSAWLALA